MTINELVNLLMGAQSIGLGEWSVHLDGNLVGYCPDNLGLVDVTTDERGHVYMNFREEE